MKGRAVSHLEKARDEIAEAMQVGRAHYSDYDKLLSELRGLLNAESKAPIARTALADELLKIGAMLTADKRFHELASRLIDLSKQVKDSGVSDDTCEIDL